MWQLRSVGIFSRKRAEEETPPIRGVLLRGGMEVQVAGESNYQDALETVCGGRSKDGADCDCVVFLVPEPSNPYDPNAVAVQAQLGDEFKTLGYLPRPAAVAYQPVAQKLFSKSLIGAVNGRIRGGWERGTGDRGHFGITIDLGPPETCIPPDV